MIGCRPYGMPAQPETSSSMLNAIWSSFFVIAAVSALLRWLVGGDAMVFAAMVESLFAMAKLSVELMVVMFGTLTLWLGLLKIAEAAGLVDLLAGRSTAFAFRLQAWYDRWLCTALELGPHDL